MQVVSHSIGIFRSHHLSLLQGQRRENDGEQITRFGSKLVDVFERVGILGFATAKRQV
jgi:hypothetical protein